MIITGRIAQEGFKALSEKYSLRNGRRIPRIWVIVADKHLARIFRKPDGHLELIGEAFSEDVTSHLNNRSIGRIFSSARNAVQHKFEPHMAQSRLTEVLFVQSLAGWLDDAEEAEAFDRLVLIAAPQLLGSLRSVLGRKVQSKIVAEVDKNFTKYNERELRAALDQILWF